MPPIAVLFDFDGVIADTENVHIAAWQRTLGRIGWEVDDEIASCAAEVDDRKFLHDLFATQKIENGDVDGWLKIKQAQTEQLLADAPRIYPGVIELIHALKERSIRLGIVTTTWRRNTEIALEAADVLSCFEVIVAKEDVENVKPAPDGYKLALEWLGITAEQAIAIEDSPTGMSSCLRANLSALAVGHRRQRGPWAGDLYVANLTDLPVVLKLLGLA